MIIELIGGSIIGSVATFFIFKRKNNVCEIGAYKWNNLKAKVFDGSSNTEGFQCPKCKAYSLRYNFITQICTCMEYPTEHFHLQCKCCKHKGLLRTADDK